MNKDYYDISRLLSTNAHYMIMIGIRSRGKSFQVKKYALTQFCEGNGSLALIRRWDTDIKVGIVRTYFDDMIINDTNTNYVYELSGGKYDSIKYRNGEWYLYIHDNENNADIECPEPFAKVFSINNSEHYKTMVIPHIKNIFFEEFVSRKGYIVNEFTEFQNLLSTIIRLRNDVKIFMAGNTINKYCPYFSEMGLSKVENMKPGDIDIYRYGEAPLRVAIEMTDVSIKGKPSDVYFAFDNPHLTMITGNNGVWEMSIYPRCPYSFDKRDILFIYFIIWERHILQCEIVETRNGMVFTFVHPKTTPIRDSETTIIFAPEYNPRPNYRRKIGQIVDERERAIEWFYKNDKVFLSDNETGEILRNYLIWCGKDIGIKA